jgi:hypothetical protein
MKKICFIFLLLSGMSFSVVAQTDSTKTYNLISLVLGYNNFNNLDKINNSFESNGISKIGSSSFMIGGSYLYTKLSPIELGLSLTTSIPFSINDGKYYKAKDFTVNPSLNIGYVAFSESYYKMVPFVGFAANFDNIQVESNSKQEITWPEIVGNQQFLNGIKVSRFNLRLGIRNDFLFLLNNKKHLISFELSYSLYPFKIVGDRIGNSDQEIKNFPELYNTSIQLCVSICVLSF